MVHINFARWSLEDGRGICGQFLGYGWTSVGRFTLEDFPTPSVSECVARTAFPMCHVHSAWTEGPAKSDQECGSKKHQQPGVERPVSKKSESGACSCALTIDTRCLLPVKTPDEQGQEWESDVQ